MLKRYWFVLAVGLVFVGGLLPSAGLGWGSKPKSTPARDLNVTLSVGKDSYRTGEAIRATLQVANHTSGAVTLVFSTSQRHDLAVETEGGHELWRWSRGRFFLQVIGKETMEPDGPPLTYHVEVPVPDEPGRYRLIGTLTTRSQVLSASAFFTVR